MFCSRCGSSLAGVQGFCPQCGQVAAPAPVASLEYQLHAYANKIRMLSMFWAIYAGLTMLSGFLGISVLRMFFSGPFGQWMHQDMPGPWFGPMFLHFVWGTVIVRAALAGVAAWGLWERTGWGRVVAIVAAFLSLLKIPFGTALGIATLVLLLGARNSSLYMQIETREQ
jgi:hypothetical protein